LTALLSFIQVTGLHAQSAAEEAIRKSLQGVFPELEVTRIRETRISGLYEVLIGPDLVYASKDGRYIFQGDLIDLREKRNMSEEIRSGIRSDMLSEISRDDYIEFSPENPRYTIYVFTDIDCGYCQRLHRDVPELNRRGVAVRYLAFPRNGLDSKTYRQMVSVWCAPDRRKAMNEAKQGMRVREKSCKNPVSRQFALGRDIGVRGTPAIYTESGRPLAGYLPPDRLLQALRN